MINTGIKGPQRPPSTAGGGLGGCRGALPALGREVLWGTALGGFAQRSDLGLCGSRLEVLPPPPTVCSPPPPPAPHLLVAMATGGGNPAGILPAYP